MSTEHQPAFRMTKRMTIRKRVAAACSQCKKGRMRCDDLRPCKRCQRSGKGNQCSSGSFQSNKISPSNAIQAWESVHSAAPDSEEGAFTAGNDVRSPDLMLPQLNTYPLRAIERVQYNQARAFESPADSSFRDFFQEMRNVQSNAPSGILDSSSFLWQQQAHIGNRLTSGSPFHQQQPSHTQWLPSLEQLIARQQEEILALVNRLHPSSALDSLLLSAMLASPSSAPESRISAALRAVAALSAGRATTLPPLSIPWTFPTTTDLARTSIGI